MSMMSSSDFDLDEDDYEALRRDDDDTGAGGTTSSESLDQAVAAELELDLDDDGDPLQLDDHDDTAPGTVDGAGGGAAAIGLKTAEAPDDGSDCAICLDGGGGEKTGAWVEPPCAHRIHERCLETWAQAKLGTCPMCRRVLAAAATTAGEEDHAAADLTAAMDFSTNYYAQLLYRLR